MQEKFEFVESGSLLSNIERIFLHGIFINKQWLAS